MLFCTVNFYDAVIFFYFSRLFRSLPCLSLNIRRISLCLPVLLPSACLLFINYLLKIESVWPGPIPAFLDSSLNDKGRGIHQGCLNPAALLSINNYRWKWSGFPGDSDRNKFYFSIIRIGGEFLHIFYARLLTNNWTAALSPSRKVQRNRVAPWGAS